MLKPFYLSFFSCPYGLQHLSFYGRVLGCGAKWWYIRKKHYIYLNVLKLIYSISLHCLFLTVVLVYLIQRCGTTKLIPGTYLHKCVCVLFIWIKVCDEVSLGGCFRFKMKCSKQTSKLMKESVLLGFLYIHYIAGTAFHFPLCRIHMSLAATGNLYTSDLWIGAPLHISFSFTCFPSGLPQTDTEANGNNIESITFANRIRGILPCPRGDGIWVSVPRHFSKSNISEGLLAR